MIANRTEFKAKVLAEEVDGKGISLEDLNDPELDYDIVMNTTSVGMAGTPEFYLIPDNLLTKDTVVFDAVWNPKDTPLLEKAKAQGCRIVYGYEMFMRQALKQLQIWFDNENLNDVRILELIEKIYHEQLKLLKSSS